MQQEGDKYHILLADDEKHLHETLRLNLELEGYEVTSAYDGKKALELIQSSYFDLLIFDVMMPELDGVSLTEAIRVTGSETPILILSARGSSLDKVIGLKKGANDYLTKPFNLEELLLRVEKLLSYNTRLKYKESPVEEYRFGGNSIDFKAHTALTHEGETISLSKKEAMLLKLLIDNKGEVVTREKILQIVWGYNIFPNTRTIDNFLLFFRKKFETDSTKPKHFLSARGVGYKFMD